MTLMQVEERNKDAKLYHRQSPYHSLYYTSLSSYTSLYLDPPYSSYHHFVPLTSKSIASSIAKAYKASRNHQYPKSPRLSS